MTYGSISYGGAALGSTSDPAGDNRFFRSTSATGQGDATITRAVQAPRVISATGQPGSAAATRQTASIRSATATPQPGFGTVSRGATTARAVTATGAPGSGGVSRHLLDLLRTTTGAGAGAAETTRQTTALRTISATSQRGNATAAQLIRHSWMLPQSPGDTGARLLVTPSSIETDHDQVQFEAYFTADKLERFDHYRDGGDVSRESTAFGAWRRISRAGRDPVTIDPPDPLSPPFGERSVFVTDFSAEEVAPRRYQVSITASLEEPRAREPLQTDPDPETVDVQSVALDPGETQTVTLSWTPGGDDLGEWGVTASSPQASDSVSVSVTDAPWGLAFPAGSITLTKRQVGQVGHGQRSGLETVTLPLRLTGSQLAVLMAVGSRIEAGRTRAVPDAPNTVVDTLPESELSCDVGVPDDADLEGGRLLLWSWSANHARPAPPAYDATVTLVRSD